MTTAHPCCSMQLFVGMDCIDTVKCVDIHHYEAPKMEEVASSEPQKDDDVTHLSNDLVLSKRGSRVIMSVEDYNKEKQAVPKIIPQVEEAIKPRIPEKLWLKETCALTGNVLQSIFSYRFYLLFSQSPAFIQLMRSLVLNQSFVKARYNDVTAFIFPLTSASSYLFLETGMLTDMIEEDCSSFIDMESTDLFAFWNQTIENVNVDNRSSMFFPGDLVNMCYLRKLSLSSTRQEESDEPIIKEIREKLLSTSLDTVDLGPKFLHMGDLSLVIKSQIKDIYNQTIGMMNEEVDWFFRQIDEMREEYRNDFTEDEFNEKIVSFLKELLIGEEEVTKKYGLRINRDVVNIRFREVILQALIRLYICKYSPNLEQGTTSLDPAPRDYLSLIIRFLKQISFYSTEEDVIQHYLDKVFCPLFESTLPRSLIKIYKELEIPCPVKVEFVTSPKKKKEIIAHKPMDVPILPKTVYRKKIPQPAKKRGDLMKTSIT